jgi:hypothetical protein
MEMNVQLHPPRPLYTRDKAPGTHWIGGWLGPRASLDAVAKRKIPSQERKYEIYKENDVVWERDISFQ